MVYPSLSDTDGVVEVRTVPSTPKGTSSKTGSRPWSPHVNLTVLGLDELTQEKIRLH